MFYRSLSVLMILSLMVTGLPAGFSHSLARAEMEVAEDMMYANAESEPLLLVRGDRDSEDSAHIVILQNALIRLGYLRDAADGVFGANTETALINFQRSNGLEPSGTADQALLDLLASGQDLVSVTQSADPQSVAYLVQEKLGQWGFLGDDPDGQIGSKTTEAIIAFKTYLRDFYWEIHPMPTPAVTPEPVNSTGYADAAIAVDIPLAQAINGDIDDELLSYVTGDIDFEVYHKNLSSGDSGHEVWRLQRRLHQLNYLAVADGAFGETTALALKYFQKKNGLTESGFADEVTQRLLFSKAAMSSEEYVNAYKFVVDISDQMVYAYQWNGSNYGICAREMICSTGKNETPTPEGSYQAAGPTGTGEWYWFSEFECYAKWATRIVGGILFHSVTYTKNKNPISGSRKNLGRKASHGCVRLKVEDAEWVYDVCDAGTTVVIQP